MMQVVGRRASALAAHCNASPLTPPPPSPSGRDIKILLETELSKRLPKRRALRRPIPRTAPKVCARVFFFLRGGVV